MTVSPVSNPGRVVGLNRSLPRSAREVADSRRRFKIGEPTGFLADDIIHL
jgi:hypothetical protein